MLTQVLHVNFSSLTVPHLISVVQGDTGRNLKCIVDDFTLDGAWTATWYVERPSDVPVYNTATIETSDNSVNLELTAQSIAEVGDNKLQVRILDADDQVVTSFACILSVKPFGGIGAVESTTESNIFDQQVEEAFDEIDTHKADALEEIDTEIDTHVANGKFPNMAAGDIISDLYAENKVPYFFRQSGGGAEVGTIESPVLVGGSVGWNQLVQNGNFAGTSNWVSSQSASNFTASNNIGSFTATSQYAVVEQNIPVINTHKYLFLSTARSDSGGSPSVRVRELYDNNQYYQIKTFSITSTWSVQSAIVTPTHDGNNIKIMFMEAGESNFGLIEFTNVILTDLTLLLGSTIADRLYTLEQSTSGSGIAQLRAWGFDFDAYIPYTAPTLKHVEGVSAHVMRDGDDNIIGNYPLDASLTLRGVPKLDANNSLYYDGDTYEPDGTVTRNCAVRAYQSGDESLADAITDGTNTVYKLSTPTTETAEPYTQYQEVDANGTEEYVSTGVVPVGHTTKYPTDLKGTFESILSAIPSANGTYALKVTVANGKHTFSWV